MAFLQTVADRVARRQMPPGLEAVDAALDTYAEATVAVRVRGLTRQMSADGLERVFTLAFAFGQLGRTFAELRDRCAELARSPRVAV